MKIHNTAQMNSTSVTIDDPVGFSVGDRKKVLLLQGPVGPFFKHLQKFLKSKNMEVTRVCFHYGDTLFSNRVGRIFFRGGVHEWRDWIGSKLATEKFDCVIYFGSERIIHKIAREVANQYGLDILSLEEGYIRPGYVTIEKQGNNAFSPLAGKLPGPDYAPQDVDGQLEELGNFPRMCIYGGTYYTIRGLLNIGNQRQLFHRNVKLLPDAFCWCRNAFRRYIFGRLSLAKIDSLINHSNGDYYLVPLQVSEDSSIKTSGDGWTTKRLISASLISFAKAAPSCSRIVFKIHPMERGHNNFNSEIRSIASALGLGSRVDIIETGPLGSLAKHCRGMITINSTSGLSAVFHGVPLMILGKAIYANSKLAFCAKNESDFDDFWSSNFVATPKLRQSYISWIKELALQPGDYYSRRGIQIACEAIFRKLGGNDKPK